MTGPARALAAAVLASSALAAPAAAWAQSTAMGADAGLPAGPPVQCPAASTCSLVVTSGPGGRSAAAAAAGVLTRWRAVGSGGALLRIVRDASGGAYAFAGAAESTVSLDSGREFAARLPVAAGDLLGISLSPGATLATGVASGAAYKAFPDAPFYGQSATPTGGGSLPLLLDATVEPDADRDGWGDVTQDACPADATAHTACTTPSGAGTIPVPDRIAPIVSGVTLGNDQLRFNTSEAGTLLVRIVRLAQGRRTRSGRCAAPTRRLRRARVCTRRSGLRGVELPTARGPGAAVLPWTGLPGGRYEIAVRVRDAAGNVSRQVTIRARRG